MEENLMKQDRLSEYHLACQKALEELVLWEGNSFEKPAEAAGKGT